MQTTSGLLTYLGHRLGAAGIALVVVLALILMAVAGLTLLAVGDLLAVGTDPIQMSPVRWTRYA